MGIIKLLMYPVSGIMKLWHIVLHSLFGIDESWAWLFAIFALVLTVRLIVFPFFWIQIKNARIFQNLRPRFAALDEEYLPATDALRHKEYLEKKKNLQKEEGYSSAAGCIPSLIQIPVFLGLYQVMLGIARPVTLPDGSYKTIGLLTSNDIAAFLSVRINDVPIAAYLSMTSEQFAVLGTNYHDVLRFVGPLALCASLFTAINMMGSVLRSWWAMDFTRKLQRRLLIFMIAMVFVGGSFPTVYGFSRPFPAAIVIYWFSNNLWTLLQNFLAFGILRLRYPLSSDFKKLRSKDKHIFFASIRALWKRRLRFLGGMLLRLIMFWSPARGISLMRSSQEEKRALRQKKHEEAEKKKADAAELKASRAALRAKNRKELAEKRAAAKLSAASDAEHQEEVSTENRDTQIT